MNSEDNENNVSQETNESLQNKLEKDIDDISKKLKDEEVKSKEYLSLLQRTQADFQNYKKRIDKENQECLFVGKQKTLLEFLKFRNTLKQAFQKENNEKCKENISHLLKNYDKVLQRQNLKKIDCLGKTFDFNFCECVFKKNVDDPNKNNKVIEVLEDGYLLENKLIMPAKVVVGVTEE